MKKIVVMLLMCAAAAAVCGAQTRAIGSKNPAAAAASDADGSRAAGANSAANSTAVHPSIVLEKDLICNVYSIAFSPDGQYIAAGYNNNEIRLWDASTGKMLKTLSGHTGIVWSVAFSPDGTTLVSGSADKTVKYWDISTGKEIRTLKGHTDTVSFVVFSTDGAYFASGSADKTIKFWDPENGRLLQTLTGHTRTIASIAYSRNGKFMASGSWDKTVKIYYALGGAEIMTLDTHTDSVFAVAFSPDGKYLASGSADRTIKIWDISTGKEVRTIRGYNDAVWALAYSPDGKTIAASAADGIVKTWDAAAGTEVHKLEGHNSPVRSIAYTPDGAFLASGDSAGRIKMWSTVQGSCLATMLQSNNGEWVTWTPEGFLTGSEWALSNLSYTVQNKQFKIDQIYDRLYRPDVVSAKMNGENISNVAKVNSLEAIIKSGTVPEVTLKVPETDGSLRDITVQVSVTDTGSGIGRVLLKLNERTIMLAEKAESSFGQTMVFEHTVSLRSGKNTIAASAYDASDLRESAFSTKRAVWEGENGKPRLFLFTAAVDTYTDPTVGALKNCVADARGLIESFTKYSGDIYSDVFVKTLFDGEVTQNNFESVLTSFGKGIGPDDVFIMYLAGHGKTHDDGDYYFIPADFRMSGSDALVKNGISKWQIIKYLSAIQPSNMLIVLDTCNAGSMLLNQREAAVVAASDSHAVIDRFALKAGYDMIAACSSYQYALDQYEGHGIFTYHIMDALTGNADLNNDGRITSTELSYYVISEVPIKSEEKWGYRQEPQRILPNLDFIVTGQQNPRQAKSLKKALAAAAVLAGSMEAAGITENELTAVELITALADEPEMLKNAVVKVKEIAESAELVKYAAETNQAAAIAAGAAAVAAVEAAAAGVIEPVPEAEKAAEPESSESEVPAEDSVPETAEETEPAPAQASSYMRFGTGCLFSGVAGTGMPLMLDAGYRKGNWSFCTTAFYEPFNKNFGAAEMFNWYFGFHNFNCYAGAGIGYYVCFTDGVFSFFLPVQAGVILFDRLDIRYLASWNFNGWFEDTVSVGYLVKLPSKGKKHE